MHYSSLWCPGAGKWFSGDLGGLHILVFRWVLLVIFGCLFQLVLYVGKVLAVVIGILVILMVFQWVFIGAPGA